jgi:Gpi18-like mannosyltransferase
VVTIASGAAAIGLFSAWTRRFLDPSTSLLAVAVLLVYPYSFYLYGAVYSDAFFLALALASFVALESRRPWLSGLCGAAAAAARPVGVALALGLALRNLELARKNGDRGRVTVRTLIPALLTLAGLAAYIVFLWHRFRAPFAFVDTEAGWHQSPGPATWFKVSFFHHVTNGNAFNVARYLAHAVMTVVALAFVPTVWRRFGRAYGVYCLAAILIPALSTKDFFSMARYVLAAFPCFAAAATKLSPHRRAVRVELAASSTMLILLCSLFNRGFYIS